VLTFLIITELKQPWRQRQRKRHLSREFQDSKKLTGSVQSLEFLKSLEIAYFPDSEKVWEIDVKSWKNGEMSFFLKLQQVLSVIEVTPN